MLDKKYENDRLITVKEVAELLGCSVSTVWRRVKKGLLPPPIRMLGMTRWSLCEINTVIQGFLAARCVHTAHHAN